MTEQFNSHDALGNQVDWLVHSYNVRRILAGDTAPAVQITEHEVSPEGILTLPPLLQCSNPIIRDGIQSLLDDRALAESTNPNQRRGWTSHQLVHDRLTKELAKQPPPVTSTAALQRRQTAWARFREYAYQWY